MRISKVEIRNFRSVQRLDLDLTRSSVVCGPNSCGKSNVLRALKFAFLHAYSAEKTSSNFCSAVTGPNAAITVRVYFDEPTANLSNALNLPPGQQVLYQIKIKRNGKPTCHLNGQLMDEAMRAAFLDEVVVVHVPPIRDLTTGGLDPFKATLAATIRKSRGSHSLVQLNKRVREAVKRSGRQILVGTQAAARSLLNVDELSVDVEAIDIDSLLPMAGITFRVNRQESGLEKLGTGHQSSVILSLYRQLGAATGKFVLYLFEEPDNHLHPTSLRAIADELKECVTDVSQAVITTHSPYFLNQFPVTDWFPLSVDANRTTTLRPRKLTKTDRELRVAFGRYGLRPPEALLAKRVVVVEGPSDVTLLRELVEIKTGRSPDRQDLLVIPAGGKDLVSDLCLLLEELGANWLGIMDWDATEDTRQPMLKKGLPAAAVAAVDAALTTIQSQLSVQGTKKPKAQKFLDGLRGELAQTATPFVASLAESVLGRHLSKARVLTPAEHTRLANAVKRKSMRPLREVLSRTKLWLWSGLPEEVLVATAAAEAIVEGRLIHHGVLAGPVQAANRRGTLVKALHSLGHSPEVLQDVIRSLHVAGELRGREWRDIVLRVTGQ